MATGLSREPHQVPTTNAMKDTNVQMPVARSVPGKMDVPAVNGQLVVPHAIQPSVTQAGTAVRAESMSAQQVSSVKQELQRLKSVLLALIEQTNPARPWMMQIVCPAMQDSLAQ